MRKALVLLCIMGSVCFGAGNSALIVKKETALVLNESGCKCEEWKGGLYSCVQNYDKMDFSVSPLADKRGFLWVQCKDESKGKDETVYIPIHSIIGIRHY